MVRDDRPFRPSLQLAHVYFQTSIGKFNKYKNTLGNVKTVITTGCDASILVAQSSTLSTTYSFIHLMHSIQIKSNAITAPQSVKCNLYWLSKSNPEFYKYDLFHIQLTCVTEQLYTLHPAT
jgi:hypothetical protein